MGKIKILSQQEIQKVAAGEVIERPANVVKELIENALDAGATSLIIYIEQGGKKTIRVIDDGFGMSPEDGHMSFVHHATSKITSVDELEGLSTFGFRGEALSSIASISRMTIITKESIALEGIKLVLLGGEVVAETKIAHTTGTDITVENLFFNVPARCKFLKTDETEWRAIYQLVQAYALVRLSCAFKLYADQKLVFHCRPCQEISERLHFFYDTRALQTFVSFSGPQASDNFSFEGVMTGLHYSRYDRTQIFFFVNGRWIKNSKLTHAFLKGYARVLPPARYPVGIVSITVDPHAVDINIHPRKDEVGFLHPKRIENALAKSVSEKLSVYMTQSLGCYDQSSEGFFDKTAAIECNSISEIYAGTSSAPILTREPVSVVVNSKKSFSDQAYFEEQGHQVFASGSVERQAFGQELPANQVERLDSGDSSAGQFSLLPDCEEQSYTLIGQIKNTYIIVETRRGVVFIDQHAAHERVLYELFEHRLAEVASVPLLFPPIFTFSSQEAELFSIHYALFEQYGILVEQCDETQYAIKKIPVMLKDSDVSALIKQTLALIGESNGIDEDLFNNRFHHALRSQIACKTAIKAGDQLNNDQMYELIRSLNNVNNRFACPHGRPTSWLTIWYELEKQFKRKV